MVRPGGFVVCRLFAAPDEMDSLDQVHDDAYRGVIGNFHALKWRVAMAVVRASGEPNIAVQTIRDNFMRVFPDRDALSRATGWARQDIDTIDVYDNSGEVYAFPTREKFLAVASHGFASVQIVEVGSYPLAERCPLLILETPT